MQTAIAGSRTLPRTQHRSALPLIVAPMFLVTSPEMVMAACAAGVTGAIPLANARTVDTLEAWLDRLSSIGPEAASWAVNLIVHRTYERAASELRLIARYQPPLVITSLGRPEPVVEAVHGYGGQVYADVSTLELARRAARSGVDGLVLVCAGAGGHTGSLNPFAFISAVREFWSGTLVLAGGIADGAGVLAAQAAGADYAYIGTRFIAARESLASDEYRSQLVRASAENIVASAAITGVTANWLSESLSAAGWDEARLASVGKTNFGGDLGDGRKAWKNVYSAGHGAGAVRRVESVAEIVASLQSQYAQAVQRLREVQRAVA